MNDVFSDGKTLSDLKVQELRQALVSRRLDGNGVKATLISRLEKALTEQGIESELFYSTIKNEINPSEEIQKTEENVVKNDLANDIFKEQQLKDEPGIASNNYQEENIKIEKDEIDQAELNGEEDEIALEDNQHTEKEVVNDANQEEIKNDNGYALHEISDAEDADEMLEEAAEEDNKNGDGGVLNKEESSTTVGASTTTMKTEETSQTSVPNKLPSGLQFPKDDPQGRRCIWIRGIPIQTKISDLKLAFMDAGFKGEAKIFMTKHATPSSAFGYMILESEEDAKAAVTKMHNSIFKGKTITVERACDSSMLQTDLIPPQPEHDRERERQRVHPPIKPPEKTVTEKPKKPPVKALPRERSPPKEKVVFVEKMAPVEERRRRSSPYRNTVARARIVREPVRPPPPRRIIGSGSKIRVLAARSPDPYERRVRRAPSPPPIRRIEEERLAEERRRFEEMMRRKEEDFARRERALKAEAEANKAKLERERLERENLELKLKLQQQERERERERRRPSPRRRTRSPPPPPRKRSRSPLRPAPPPKRMSPVRRPRSPPRRSPVRRSPPPRSHHYHEPPAKEVYGARRRSRSPIDRRPVNDDRRPPPDSRITLRYDDGYGRLPAAPSRRSPINDRPPPHRNSFESRDRPRNATKADPSFRDEREQDDRNSRRDLYSSVNSTTTNHRDPSFNRNTDFPSYSAVTSTSQFVQQPVFAPSNSRTILPTPSGAGWPTQTLTPSQFTAGIVPGTSPWPSVPSTLPTWGTSVSQSFNPSNTRYRF